MTSHWRLAAIVMPLLTAVAPGVQAFERSGSTLYTGVFHLASGQVAQLNVGHLGGPDTAPASCTVRLSFYGAGRRLVRAQNRTLAVGDVVSLNVSYSELAALATDDAATGRKPLLAEIKGFNPQPDPPGCVATMEIFNGRSGVSMGVSNPEIVPGR
jgi:hypothetical protein